MIQASPADIAIDALNSVLTLFGDATLKLQQAQWNLASLLRRHPTSTPAALGLLHIHQMLGDRDEAMHISRELWGRRGSMSVEQTLVLAILDCSMGEYERALQLAGNLSGQTSQWQEERRSAVLTECLFTLWRPASFSPHNAELSGPFGQVLAELERACLTPHMEARQAIVNAILIPKQCGSLHIAGPDGGEGVRVTRSPTYRVIMPPGDPWPT